MPGGRRRAVRLRARVRARGSEWRLPHHRGGPSFEPGGRRRSVRKGTHGDEPDALRPESPEYPRPSHRVHRRRLLLPPLCPPPRRAEHARAVHHELHANVLVAPHVLAHRGDLRRVPEVDAHGLENDVLGRDSADLIRDDARLRECAARDDHRAGSHARELDGHGASDARAGSRDEDRGSRLAVTRGQPRGHAHIDRSAPLKYGDTLAV